MNLPQPILPRRRQSRAFTLTELMVVMSIFSLVVTAVITVQIFGMKMYQISEAKMSTTASGRKALNRIRGDILEGKKLVIQNVQNGNPLSRLSLVDNSPQVGNALQIFASATSTNFALYYTDTNENCLKHFNSADNGVEIIARDVTNHFAFQSESFEGNVLTNNQNNRVIRVLLEFYKWEFGVRGGSNSSVMYDSYRLQTRITRRTIIMP